MRLFFKVEEPSLKISDANSFTKLFSWFYYLVCLRFWNYIVSASKTSSERKSTLIKLPVIYCYIIFWKHNNIIKTVTWLLGYQHQETHAIICTDGQFLCTALKKRSGSNSAILVCLDSHKPKVTIQWIPGALRRLRKWNRWRRASVRWAANDAETEPKPTTLRAALGCIRRKNIPRPWAVPPSCHENLKRLQSQAGSKNHQMQKWRCPSRATPQWTLQTPESLRQSTGPHGCSDVPLVRPRATHNRALAGLPGYIQRSPTYLWHHGTTTGIADWGTRWGSATRQSNSRRLDHNHTHTQSSSKAKLSIFFQQHIIWSLCAGNSIKDHHCVVTFSGTRSLLGAVVVLFLIIISFRLY